MYHVCTILWYVLYQAVVLAVPTLGTRRTIGWYERYQPWVHPETRGLIHPIIPYLGKTAACLAAFCLPYKKKEQSPPTLLLTTFFP